VNQNVSDFMEFKQLDLRDPPKSCLIPKTWIVVVNLVFKVKCVNLFFFLGVILYSVQMDIASRLFILSIPKYVSFSNFQNL
jgi:hypothetical protein